jgi:L-ascorbate metabolism protein UlaG (beta-lactamase superfamily)
MFRQIPPEAFSKMQPGGTKDFKYCKVTMVHSSNKSVCPGPQNVFIPGGNACGFIITIPHHNQKIWHLGDTAVFGDMKLIDDLYKPNVALVPIGEQFTMNVREAAYAVANFMPGVKTIIPMHLCAVGTSMDNMKYDEFIKLCTEMGAGDKTYIHPKDFFGGKALLE